MFMNPQFHEGSVYLVETNHGTEIVPLEVCGYAGEWGGIVASALVDYLEGTPLQPDATPEQLTGVYWRLSAPGYLDCTAWSFADSLIEAIRDCYELYVDDPVSETEMIDALADELPGFSEFWHGYLLAVAFTCRDTEGEPLDIWSNPGGDIRDVVDTDDVESALRSVSDETYRTIRAECFDFCLEFVLQMSSETLSDNDMEHAGSDFHYTRNGHGAGFWDGDWGEYGDRLTGFAKEYGPAELTYYTEDTATSEPKECIQDYYFDLER